MLKWLKKFWCSKKPQPEHPYNFKRRTVDANNIQARLEGLGWKVIELPIKKNDPDPGKRIVTKWKLIAAKGVRSYEVSGKTRDEAMRNLGSTLGVIPKE